LVWGNNRKTIMKTILSILSVLLLLHTSFGIASEKDRYSTYSKVKIHVSTPEDIVTIQSRGIDLDHYVGKLGEGIEVVINQDAIEKLQSIGMPYAIMIADMDEYYRNRPKENEASLGESRRILERDGIHSFRYGSMGGFLTYAEMVRQLDTMRLQFPNLITSKESLGVSEEGRIIWGAEISDNPGVPEPGEAVAYYDALHHAREPEAMATIMYYMYWLLDNYGTNPEATYLVNNRRMYFVPIVNVDGYVYNQSINPNGGGSWRKNRRNNGGSYGVDLNRNYSYMWGYDNTGSSPTPSAETYRGPSALSEPEARAVRNVALRLMPRMAWSTHSVAGRYLNPYGYKDTVISYEYYAEFASDYSGANNYLYGTVYQMLDYNSNGTTRDFMHHDVGCYTWTPEVGGSDFWPAQSEIVPVAQENLYGCKYLSWVAGAFADYQSFQLVGRQFALRGDTLRFNVTLRNKGLTLNANSVNVTVQSLYANATPVVSAASYVSIPPRESSTNTTPFAFMIGSSAATLDEMRFVAVVTQEGLETSRDTFSVIVGYPRVLFEENSETGINSWTRSGTGILWDTTFVMAYKGMHSIADSRYGNVANSSTNYLALNNAIDLAGAVNPRLEFFARWANENGFDYARIQLSTNNGSTWTNMAGRHTRTIGGQPSYSANKGTWAWEFINLTPYVGQQVKLRFNLVSDTGLRGDGFYFDDLRVVDYRDTVVTGAEEDHSVPLSFSLEQNYPNPFNPATRIEFQIREAGHVSLKIFDVLGREVATLVNEAREPGSYKVSWDASNVGSGVYFYRLTAGSNTATRKLLLMR
jgi:carboxypeptidase T